MFLHFANIDEFPRTPNLSRRTFQALVSRDMSRSSTEAQWLRLLIRELAINEQYFEGLTYFSDSDRDKQRNIASDSYDRLLSLIATGKAPRKMPAHDRTAVRIQWRHLAREGEWAFLRCASLPTRAQYFWEKRYIYLCNIQRVPCWCRYNTSWLEESPHEKTVHRLAKHTSQRDLMLEILADAHASTPSTIEALL